MTAREAYDLYRRTAKACGILDSAESWEGSFDHEREEIHYEVELMLAARSDRMAGKTILWWGCWSKKLTATRFARTLRELAKEGR